MSQFKSDEPPFDIKAEASDEDEDRDPKIEESINIKSNSYIEDNAEPLKRKASDVSEDEEDVPLSKRKATKSIVKDEEDDDYSEEETKSRKKQKLAKKVKKITKSAANKKKILDDEEDDEFDEKPKNKNKRSAKVVNKLIYNTKYLFIIFLGC